MVGCGCGGGVEISFAEKLFEGCVWRWSVGAGEKYAGDGVGRDGVEVLWAEKGREIFLGDVLDCVPW